MADWFKHAKGNKIINLFAAEVVNGCGDGICFGMKGDQSRLELDVNFFVGNTAQLA